MGSCPHAPAEKHLDIAGTTVSYLQGGNGPPLMWLHGIWGEPGWRRHLQALAHHFTVYKPHLPGYAGSQRPPWLTSVRDLAYFMLDVLDALGLARTMLSGHCLGGWLGAEIGMLRPQRLIKLALISPLGLLKDWTQAPNLFYADPAELPGYFFSHDTAHDSEAQCFIPQNLHAWEDDFLINREASAYYAFDPYLHDPTLLQRLHHLKAPTLLLWGGDDAIVDMAHAQEWASRLPEAETLTIPGAGHIPFVAALDTVQTRLVAFLSNT
jgi:pimeloyl-ACP methyl ester carboxylesterase